ncbi:MAG TPA: hypothetical protein G4N98_05370 [Thermoflexia bacterium]|nr:hypothetical protein [Thermoflexia bacterium]
MNWINFIVALIGWSGIVAIQTVLMKIACFFEENSGKQTYHRLYYLVILCTGVGAGRYLWRLLMPASSPCLDFLGDPLANLLFSIAGLGLLLLGTALYKKMMGDAE